MVAVALLGQGGGESCGGGPGGLRSCPPPGAVGDGGLRGGAAEGGGARHGRSVLGGIEGSGKGRGMVTAGYMDSGRRWI